MGMLLKFFLCRACVEAKSTRHPIYITPDWHVSQRRDLAVVFPLTFLALFQEVGRGAFLWSDIRRCLLDRPLVVTLPKLKDGFPY